MIAMCDIPRPGGLVNRYSVFVVNATSSKGLPWSRRRRGNCSITRSRLWMDPHKIVQFCQQL